MLGIRVPPQVDLALEGSGTEETGERFEAGVFTAVGDEIGGLTERLATLATRVRLLA
jgi:hypothetical protein